MYDPRRNTTRRLFQATAILFAVLYTITRLHSHTFSYDQQRFFDDSRAEINYQNIEQYTKHHEMFWDLKQHAVVYHGSLKMPLNYAGYRVAYEIKCRMYPSLVVECNAIQFLGSMWFEYKYSYQTTLE